MCVCEENVKITAAVTTGILPFCSHMYIQTYFQRSGTACMLDKCNTCRFQFSVKYVVCIYTYEVLTVLQYPHSVHKVPVGGHFICKIKFEKLI